ncbi:MAG: hypothetical protein ACFE8E_07090 [Candidatus Hodarchaeota archaeon]
MSLEIIENEEYNENKKEITDLELEYILANAFIPFSMFLDKTREPDIYNGKENIPFEKRHPIFRALMRIEFESRKEG